MKGKLLSVARTFALAGMSGLFASALHGASDPCHLTYNEIPRASEFLYTLRSAAEYERLFTSPIPGLTLVKFTIHRKPHDNQRGPNPAGQVYFQNTTRYLFHAEFAAKHIPEFAGMNPRKIDTIVAQEQGSRFITGSIVFRPCSRHPSVQRSEQGFIAFTISLPSNPTPEIIRIAYDGLARSIPFAPDALIYACAPAQCQTLQGSLRASGVPWDSEARLLRIE